MTNPGPSNSNSGIQCSPLWIAMAILGLVLGLWDSPLARAQQPPQLPQQAQATTTGPVAALASPPPSKVAVDLCQGDVTSLGDQAIITHETVCADGLTPPSLWWTREQISHQLRTSNKLVKGWSAQIKTPQAPGQVRLTVNPQMWSVMDYFERYDFINTFGLTARDFGYQTDVYNSRGTKLASYQCRFDGQGLNGEHCSIRLESSLNFGFRGSNPNSLF
jgi:hypothetical protein